MKKLLTLAAIGETATGLALLIVPSLVVRLLFDAELTGVAIPATRVTGSYVACLAHAASGASLVQVATD